MTAITIDTDKAIELLEKQVEKKGEDYVYPYDDCVYFAPGDVMNQEGERAEKGTPLCIVGNVYADLGLTVDDLYNAISWERDDELSQDQQGDMLEIIPDPEKVILTDDALTVMLEAQMLQDLGSSWGAALASAKAVAA